MKFGVSQIASGAEKKATMKMLRNLMLAQLVWFIFCSGILFSQQSNISEHQRNVSNCRNGWETCDRSQLTDAEVTALAVADHRRNVSNCESAFTSCDHSRLTAMESRNIAVLEHQRNLAGCKSGIGSCDDLALTSAEVTEVKLARRERNLSDCREGATSCDHSALTSAEAKEVTAGDWNATCQTAVAVGAIATNKN